MPQHPIGPEPDTAAEFVSLSPPLDSIAPLRIALRGRYEFERELGQGAFATVYLARDLKHERKVAIKVLHADPNSELGELRFIREIRMLARLQHPNILPLHDSGHVETLLYYVMPYVSGETLRDRIRAERSLPWETACSIAHEVADALAYAHGQGVIHRDIKPENILLSAGHPMLADFGIARAIDVAGLKQLTRTGMGSPGTPAYMSPEQLLGVGEIDARSDIYSLGCVLYEMLTGSAPFADEDAFVRRFTDPPPSATALQRAVPDWLDAALRPALERDPLARYATATEFASALRVPGAKPGGSHPSRKARTAAAVRRRWSARTAFGLLALVAFATVGAVVSSRSERLRELIGIPSLDSLRFVALPFVGPAVLTSDLGGRLYEKLADWQGLPLVPDTRVFQAVVRAGQPITESDAQSLAASLGAGKLIWGSVDSIGPTRRVRFHLYDVRSRELTDDFVFDYKPTRPADFGGVVARLIGFRGRPASAESCDLGTRSFAAWSDCGQAHAELAAWNLAAAEREFRSAIAADANYPAPHLWLAQLLSWRGSDSRSEWREHVDHFASRLSNLSIRDRSLAQGLISLRNADFPHACAAYSSLVHSTSSDFVALFGLGQCQELDSVVERSNSSTSGWRFRSSNETAAKFYMQALRLEPRAHVLLPFERLQRLLPTASTQLRFGFMGADRELFASYPSLRADTVAFVPYGLTEFAKLPTREIPGQQKALRRDSDLLLDFALSWSRQSGSDPSAFEALADLLETRGEVFEASGPQLSALTAIRHARELTRDPQQRLRLAAREVSIRFKRSEFATSRALSDSVLATPDDSASDLRARGGLAALTGRLRRTSRLALLTGAYVPASNFAIPSSVALPAATFFGSAALGLCGPEIQKAEGELRTAIQSSYSETDRQRVETDLTARPLSLMTPCTTAHFSTGGPASANSVLRMQQALAAGNRGLLRRMLDSTKAVTRVQRPSDLSMDYTYQLAALRAAAGDTTSAIRQLDIALAALPNLSALSLRDIAPAAAAVRAMALRAQLADATGDRSNARRWARAVTVLWSGADEQLQPLVKSMRLIAEN